MQRGKVCVQSSRVSRLYLGMSTYSFLNRCCSTSTTHVVARRSGARRRACSRAHRRLVTAPRRREARHAASKAATREAASQQSGPWRLAWRRGGGGSRTTARLHRPCRAQNVRGYARTPPRTHTASTQLMWRPHCPSSTVLFLIFCGHHCAAQGTAFSRARSSSTTAHRASASSTRTAIVRT